MIAKDELKNEQAKAAGVMKDIPQTRFSQNPIEFQLEGLKITHDAMLWRLIGMLQGDDESGMGLLVDVLDVKHAGAMMRQMLFRTQHQKTGTLARRLTKICESMALHGKAISTQCCRRG